MIPVTASEAEFRRKLSALGYSSEVISAVWPEWWDSRARSSVAATTELGMTVARRLGIVPSTLFEEDTPRFAWRDTARYKNLGTATEQETALLTSFATSLARVAIRATRQEIEYRTGTRAAEIKTALGVRGIGELLAATWALGIPVIQTTLFPLPRKRMHAVSAALGTRHAIVLGVETRYPGKAAFTIAHELGHIFLGHLREGSALVDVEDPAAIDEDGEEAAASRFALELLTGAPELELVKGRNDYNAASLAASARSLARDHDIDPSVIVLAFAHQHGEWARATAALNLLTPATDVGAQINRVARGQLQWDALQMDEQLYLDRVLGGQP